MLQSEERRFANGMIDSLSSLWYVFSTRAMQGWCRIAGNTRNAGTMYIVSVFCRRCDEIEFAGFRLIPRLMILLKAINDWWRTVVVFHAASRYVVEVYQEVIAFLVHWFV